MPLLVIGGEGLVHVWAGRTQVAVPCETLADGAPQAAWIRITSCELDYLGAAYRESGGETVELLFPVRRAGEDPSRPVSVVAATRDPAVLALLQPAVLRSADANQEAYLVMMLRVVTVLRAAREVDGYARRGVLGTISARRSLDAMRVPLAGDAVVIDVHAAPDVVGPGALAAAGLLLAAGGTVIAWRRQARARKGLGVPSAVVAPAAQAWRGLLVLHLEDAATTADIEHAPALGPRPEVERKFAAAMPGLRFDERGRAALDTPTLNVSVDIGADALAWTAVVHVAGPEGAAAIRRLLDATGWRVYIPRRGEFLDPRELVQP
jgi:hypothetical protein